MATERQKTEQAPKRPEEGTKPTDALAASSRGALFLIVLQVSTRALTFALNQVLLRFLSPALLGASVQLELFIISAHHFARESLRVACQRQPQGGDQAAINLSYLSLVGGVPIVIGFAQWYLRSGFPNVPYFVEALWVCQVAAMVELLSEPAFVAVQQNMQYGTRASAEASAVVLKTIATAGTVFWSQSRGLELGALPFAVGELAYCSTLTAVYIWRTIPTATKQNFSLLPKKIEQRRGQTFIFSRFPQTLVTLSVALYVQTGIKYLLTQGDVLVSTTFASLEDQGMYALAANYGGLIARMVFRPIEDTSRNLFAQLCSGTQPRAQDIKKAATVLRDTLRIYLTFSLVFALGPTAAPLLLRLVAGSRWTDSGAGDVLGTYTYCIPLLAINGVSEAFVAATASTGDLHRQSIWMGGFSLLFAGSAYVFLKVLALGAEGLVWANCVNMALRIIFNLSFAKEFFARHKQSFGLSDIVPTLLSIGATGGMSVLLAQAGPKGDNLLRDLVTVTGYGLAFVTLILGLERQFLLGCIQRYAPTSIRNRVGRWMPSS
ncbi:Oligosaccharide translocation RFT1 [Lecanosticta acicola]|uniref:Man(5)GlcNAc(2)-PP-dolichol translocation protein RFT1 n=1 Tax=Lecanosticta acicola TaxID=111012 RepID=A0AAI8YV72_9PEZI|nr:Oligosaccharide translocation RFT1 [Lecanosticta acicola]